MTLEIKLLTWDQAKKYGGFNWLMASQPPLDNEFLY
jgi:hypothetical protein